MDVRCLVEERSFPLPQCAFEAYCVKFLITHLRNYRSRCLNVRLRHIRGAILLQRLRMNQGVLSATAAHEGLRPVRMQMRIDLAIVSGDATKVQEQHRQCGKE
jgi:hypothetical protein